MKTQYKWNLCVVVGVLIFAACSKSEEYKDYMANGEIIYPARADSLKVYPGEERIALAWLTTDPRIIYFNVFWNRGSDSVRVPAVQTGNLNVPDTNRVIISGLEEGTYEFSVFSYDEEGNSSIPTLVQAAAYGENYRSTLFNRAVESVEYISGTGFASIKWHESEALEAGVELIYTAGDGAERELLVQKDSLLTRLPDYKVGTDVRYRTLHLPDSAAIDTFRTDYEIIPAPEISYKELDKSLFAPVYLPGDVGSAWGWELPFIWDNNTAEGSGFHTPEVVLPQHFTIDLGVSVVLREMKAWQRQGADMPYNAGNLKRFEVWGSNDPAPDGSFTGWVKLADCESIKPSGLPLGSVTQEDIDYSAAGEVFLFPEGTPAVRYIRIKILENWSGSLSSHLMEVSFKGEF